jgi:serine/threonine-protein kinase
MIQPNLYRRGFALRSKPIRHGVKTDNILVNEKNQIKILDFGLAKLRGSLKLTKTSSTIGTVAYMAPEQIQGEEVDARSDIFSSGVVLFEMLTGHLPFKGEHEAGVIYSILNTEPEPLLHHVPDPPSELSMCLTGRWKRILTNAISPSERW